MDFNVNAKFIKDSNAFNILMCGFDKITFSTKRKIIVSFDITSKYKFTFEKREI